jgi:predicted ester cyclase
MGKRRLSCCRNFGFWPETLWNNANVAVPANQQEEKMTQQQQEKMAEPERVLRRYVEEVLNAGDSSAIDTFVDPSLEDAGSWNQELGLNIENRGRDGLKQGIQQLREAVPDLRYTISDVKSEGDNVTFTWTASGTHRGPRELRGQATTNKAGEVSGTAWVKVQDGKIVEYGNDWDPADLRSQLA